MREATEQSWEAISYAAVAKVSSSIAEQAIIEFCCSDKSMIEDSSENSLDCMVYQPKEKEDMKTDSGLEHAPTSSTPPPPTGTFFSSAPCPARRDRLGSASS